MIYFNAVKALNVKEIENLVDESQVYLGSQVQEVVSMGQAIGLGLWSPKEGKVWLWCDLKPARPLFLFLKDLPFKVKKQIKPMGLFLRSHCVGKSLLSVELNKAKGRVVEFVFQGDPAEPICQMDFRIFPHGQNLIVSVGKKIMSWSKVKELTGPGITVKVTEFRSTQEIRSQWEGDLKGGPTASSAAKKTSGDLKKKKQLLKKIESEIEKRENSQWQALGEWLSSHQSIEVPAEWSSLIDKKEAFSWNLQNSYEKAKKDKQKLSGLLERKKWIEQEIAALESGEAPAEKSTESKLGPSLLASSQSKGRRMIVSPQVEAYAGKSAKDNLSLLRKAKAWDYWMHVKDFPGCHGILRRARHAQVSDEEFRRVAQWLLELQWGAKSKLKKGEPFEFLIAECRHVRPIKGDRLGRVTFQNERVIRLKY